MMQKLLKKVETLEAEQVRTLYNLLLVLTEDDEEPVKKPEPEKTVTDLVEEVESLYSANATMRMLGYQYAPDSDRVRTEIEDIVRAYGLQQWFFDNTYHLFSLTLDVLNLGIIEGKRELRQNKKATAKPTK